MEVTYNDCRMKTKLEILNETVKYYTEEKNDRSMDSIDCVYNSEEGNHCAVGRCFTEEIKDLGLEFEQNTDADVFELERMTIDGKETIDHLLLEEYRGHDSKFWFDLQRLHDNSMYWNFKYTLSANGESFVEALKEKYK